MPFKAKAKVRNHIPAQKYRVTNWPEYEASLKQRGNLLVRFNEEVIAQWQVEPRMTPGGQAAYSSLAILTGLALRAVLHTALRQTEGLLTSILALLGLTLSAPDHTTFSRRGSALVVPSFHGHRRATLTSI